MKKKLVNDPEASPRLWEVFNFTSSARSEEVVNEANNLLNSEPTPLHALYKLQDNLEPNELVGAAFMFGEFAGEEGLGRAHQLIQTPSSDAETWEVFDFPSAARAEAVMELLNQMLSSGLGILGALYTIQGMIPTNELLAVAFALGSLVDREKMVLHTEEKPA